MKRIVLLHAAKSTGARVIDAPRNTDEAWPVSTVQQLARLAGIEGPGVAARVAALQGARAAVMAP